jgi:hypothetical protein
MAKESRLIGAVTEKKKIRHRLSGSMYGWYYFFPIVKQPLVGQGHPTIEALRLHSGIAHSVGLLWTNDRPVAGTSTWQHTTLTIYRHPFSPEGLEPAIPGSERPRTNTLDAWPLVSAVYINNENKFPNYWCPKNFLCIAWSSFTWLRNLSLMCKECIKIIGYYSYIICWNFRPRPLGLINFYTVIRGNNITDNVAK